MMASIMQRTLGSMSAFLRNAASSVRMLSLVCQKCKSSLLPTTAIANSQQTQVRTKFTNWHMLKDNKRRQTIRQYNLERMRINSLRKNTVLPRELQEIADKEIHAFPRDSSITRIRGRCVVTSRPRGVLRRWRISRIVWRHLADYNYLSGVTRASW